MPRAAAAWLRSAEKGGLSGATASGGSEARAARPGTRAGGGLGDNGLTGVDLLDE